MIRKARVADAKRMHSLINFWAKKSKVLPRSLNYIYENIRDFWVYEQKGRFLGCCALHIVGWQDLAEIKSLVVDNRFRRRGIAKSLVASALCEAKELKVRDVFALTFVPKFFYKLKFRRISQKRLPHKIWSDCVNCPFFPDCNEQAVIIRIK